MRGRGAGAAGSRGPLGQRMEWWTSQAESAKPASVTWGGPPPSGLSSPVCPREREPLPANLQRCWRTPRGRAGWTPGGVTVYLGSAGCRSCSHNSAPEPGRYGGAPGTRGRGGAQARTPPGRRTEGGAATQPADGLLHAEMDLPQQVGTSGTHPSPCPSPRALGLTGRHSPALWRPQSAGGGVALTSVYFGLRRQAQPCFLRPGVRSEAQLCLLVP